MAISLVGYDRQVLAPKGCNRCGSHTVAWQTAKSGKWYLTECFDFDGEWRGNYRDFHSTYCGNGAKHELKQAEISDALTTTTKVRKKHAKESVEQVERENARMFLALHDLCKSHPEEAREEIADRERKVKNESNGLTMDYMTEYTRSLEKIKQWKAEIAFMQAALGDVVYDG